MLLRVTEDPKRRPLHCFGKGDYPNLLSGLMLDPSASEERAQQRGRLNIRLRRQRENQNESRERYRGENALRLLPSPPGGSFLVGSSPSEE